MLYEPIPSETLFWAVIERLSAQFPRRTGLTSIMYGTSTRPIPPVPPNQQLLLPAPTQNELNGGSARG